MLNYGANIFTLQMYKFSIIKQKIFGQKIKKDLVKKEKTYTFVPLLSRYLV